MCCSETIFTFVLLIVKQPVNSKIFQMDPSFSFSVYSFSVYSFSFSFSSFSLFYSNGKQH
jgi:hypothetical protein